jgi:hypothetical protein
MDKSDLKPGLVIGGFYAEPTYMLNQRTPISTPEKDPPNPAI